MSYHKRVKDWLVRITLGNESVPKGLFELSEYFRLNGPINFEYHKENGETVAVSTNFRCGGIVTSGNTPKELDKNIRDAILTTFEVPSSYEKEASIVQVGKESKQYALA